MAQLRLQNMSIGCGNNLNVGSGLGYFSRYAEEEGLPMSSLEIAEHIGALPLRNFALYDGRHMPFEKRRVRSLYCDVCTTSHTRLSSCFERNEKS
jgi:hypothetical protein